MRPLIFEFTESPGRDESPFVIFDYDERLCLNVDKSTGRPAVDLLLLGTETFTKTYEETDSDKQNLEMVLSTATATRVTGEDSDEDPSRMAVFMATETFTAATGEGTDSDVEPPPELPGRPYAAFFIR